MARWKTVAVGCYVSVFQPFVPQCNRSRFWGHQEARVQVKIKAKRNKR